MTAHCLLFICLTFCQQNSKPVVSESVTTKGRPNHEKLGKALLSAVFESQTEKARDLIKQGADVSYVGPVTADVGSGKQGIVRSKSSALIIASEIGDARMVKFLLSRHARVNLRDREGNTALHAATDEGYVDIAKMLLAHGADYRIKNVYGNTPLDLTDRPEQPASVKDASAIEKLIRRRMRADARLRRIHTRRAGKLHA
jgi:ankyrin repeat protein